MGGRVNCRLTGIIRIRKVCEGIRRQQASAPGLPCALPSVAYEESPGPFSVRVVVRNGRPSQLLLTDEPIRKRASRWRGRRDAAMPLSVSAPVSTTALGDAKGRRRAGLANGRQKYHQSWPGGWPPLDCDKASNNDVIAQALLRNRIVAERPPKPAAPEHCPRA
jgi:hypothetical protein